MQVIRRSSFNATPWKNGGGVTHEAIRVPAGGASFRWRVSVADIAVSGPFSDFAGYQRTMILLRGAGIRLTFEDTHQTYLREIGDLVEFDGALPTRCELLDGPCTDLNLMVSTSLPAARVWTERLAQSGKLDSPRPGTLLAFVISSMMAVVCAGRESIVLNPWDIAVLGPDDDESIELAPVEAATPPLVFFAALKDN
jgi:environmental stress-induced protein Ves